MIENWKIGDLVQLKSGGPIMTVTSNDPGPSLMTVGGVREQPTATVECIWFGKDDKPSERSFPSGTLKRYEGE